MAINRGTKNVALSSEERTWRINIETPKGGDPVVTIYREIVTSDADGIISKTPSSTVMRSLSATAAQSVKVGSGTVTVGDVAALIADLADAWRNEDSQKEASAEPRLGPPQRQQAAPVTAKEVKKK